MLDLDKLNNLTKKEQIRLSRSCKINLSRKSFYHFCKTLYPKIYTIDKLYLKDLCTKLQQFYENKLINKNTGLAYTILIVNMPPRFYKSFTIGLFEAWIFGLDHKNQCITACYSKELALLFSKNLRGHIMQPKAKNGVVVYSDIFPLTKIKKGHSAVGEWALSGSHMSFKATSFGSSVTGFGTNGLAVIDDQINDAQDASNESLLSDNYFWFCNTFNSRIEKGAKLIINMTRWSDGDICGRILVDDVLRDEVFVIKYEAMNRITGEILCPAIMDEKKYKIQQKIMDNAIFMANYHQTPVNNEGRLYKLLRTYDKATIEFNPFGSACDIRCIIDPSDGKNDYMCAVAYAVFKNQAYILDVLYTNKPSEINPNAVAKFLMKNNVRKYKCETNKGRQFALDIDEILKRVYATTDKKLTELYNTENKMGRIANAAYWVQDNILFPKNWNLSWRIFYDHIFNFQYGGRNKFDDAPDVITMIKEDVHVNGNQFNNPFGFVIKEQNLEKWELYA